jgi:hypothetical protein
MAEERPSSFSAGQRLGIGLNVTAAVLALLAIVVMVNYLAARHFRRWYWSDTANWQLQPLSVSVLRSLTNPVHVVAFFNTDDPLFPSVRGLLQEYSLRAQEMDWQRRGPQRLVVEVVDPERNPARARKLMARYGLTESTTENFVLFACEGRRQIVRQVELSDYDFSAVLAGQSREVQRTGFKGELVFTSALVRVSEADQPKAYFLQGHNELDPASDRAGDQEGCGDFARVLDEKNIAWEKLYLVGTNEVPADCDLLIVPGPRDALLPAELEKLHRYLNQGGRLFVWLGPPTSRTGLETLLARWGVDAGWDVVVDQRHSINGQGVVSTNFAAHPVTRPLANSRVFFLSPRSVNRRASEPVSADAPRVEEIVRTSVEGVALTDLRDGVAHPHPGRDREGEIPLVAAVERGSIQGVSADRSSTRLIVAGEAWFCSNPVLASFANREFASLAVNWLLDRPYLLAGLGPRPVTAYKVTLTDAELSLARWLMLVVMPGGALLLGSLVWLRRRS